MRAKEILGVLNRMSDVLKDKGYVVISMNLEVIAHQGFRVYSNVRDSVSENTEYQFTHGDTDIQALDKMWEWINAKPSKADREASEYTRRVAHALEYGEAKGLDDIFLAPLRAQMKKLSKNIIEHKPSVPATKMSEVLDDDIPF